jgi:hypothetical protein
MLLAVTIETALTVANREARIRLFFFSNFGIWKRGKMKLNVDEQALI